MSRILFVGVLHVELVLHATVIGVIYEFPHIASLKIHVRDNERTFLTQNVDIKLAEKNSLSSNRQKLK